MQSHPHTHRCLALVALDAVGISPRSTGGLSAPATHWDEKYGRLVPRSFVSPRRHIGGLNRRAGQGGSCQVPVTQSLNRPLSSTYGGQWPCDGRHGWRTAGGRLADKIQNGVCQDFHPNVLCWTPYDPPTMDLWPMPERSLSVQALVTESYMYVQVRPQARGGQDEEEEEEEQRQPRLCRRAVPRRGRPMAGPAGRLMGSASYTAAPRACVLENQPRGWLWASVGTGLVGLWFPTGLSLPRPRALPESSDRHELSHTSRNKLTPPPAAAMPRHLTCRRLCADLIYLVFAALRVSRWARVAANRLASVSR